VFLGGANFPVETAEVRETGKKKDRRKGGEKSGTQGTPQARLVGQNTSKGTLEKPAGSSSWRGAGGGGNLHHS